MSNEKFLECASKLQREFAELYGDAGMGLTAIHGAYIHVSARRFHELERENLLEHISKKYEKGAEYWEYDAMTPQGVKVIALEDLDERKVK